MADSVSRLVERQRIDREMKRAIAIPVRRNRISSSQREAIENDDGGPTMYSLQRRAELMGEATYCLVETHETSITGANTGILTGTALGILRTRDMIAAIQFKAGALYAGMRAMLFARAIPASTSIFRMIALDLSEREEIKRLALETPEDHAERVEEARIMYYRGDNRLRQLPYARGVREVLRRVCIDDQLPDPHRPNQLARLKEGLQELSDTWQLEKTGGKTR